MAIEHITLTTAINGLKHLKLETRNTIIRQINLKPVDKDYDLKLIYKLAKDTKKPFACMQLLSLFPWHSSFEGSNFWNNVYNQLKNHYPRNS